MKIECVKEKIQEAVAKADKVTSKNATLPILANILLEVKSDGLVVKSTNLDVGVELIVSGKVTSTGSVVVSGHTLHSLVQNITDSKITLEATEQTLLVSSQNTSTTIKTVPSDDFPSIPTIAMRESFSINTSDFLEGIKSVWYAASSSSMKPELSSVFITSTDDEIVFVATDSFRLAEKKIRAKKVQKFSDILLPVKNITDIVKVLDGVDEQTFVQISEGQIAFKTDEIYITSRLVEGNFPDYKQIIPKENTTTATVLKQDLLNGIRTAHIFSDKFNKITFHIEPTQKKMYVETKNADVGENTTTIKASLDGNDIAMHFNNKYIVDSLQAIPTDSIKLSCSVDSKPMVITGVSDSSFLYLAMPMSS